MNIIDFYTYGGLTYKDIEKKRSEVLKAKGSLDAMRGELSCVLLADEMLCLDKASKIIDRVMVSQDAAIKKRKEASKERIKRWRENEESRIDSIANYLFGQSGWCDLLEKAKYACSYMNSQGIITDDLDREIKSAEGSSCPDDGLVGAIVQEIVLNLNTSLYDEIREYIDKSFEDRVP